MTPRDLITVAVVPALSLLPGRMDSMAARAMMIAIADQETDLKARRQEPHGPARGLWQFEKIAVEEVLTHHATRNVATEMCGRLIYPVEGTRAARRNVLHAAIEHNDVLACVFARLLLWRLPERLPRKDETALAYRQYLEAWKPGGKRPGRWPTRFEAAWRAVR